MTSGELADSAAAAGTCATWGWSQSHALLCWLTASSSSLPFHTTQHSTQLWPPSCPGAPGQALLTARLHSAWGKGLPAEAPELVGSPGTHGGTESSQPTWQA